MIRKVLIFAALPLFAADATRVATTETVPFPGAGTLRFERSSGEIHIQAWDRPEIEIVFSKSTYDPKAPLDRVHMTVKRNGDDVVVSTAVPSRDIQIDYQVHAPRNIALAIDHNKGGVYVTGIAGDIRASVRNGQITLRLPENGVYAVDAKCKTGQVYSDFAGGTEKFNHRFGESFAKPGDAPHKLDLRIGFGDILILKTPYRPQAST